MVAARTPQTFLGVDQEGYTCIVQTNGNPMGHIVLRGGKRPNYDPISIAEARLGLIGHQLPEAIMVDCSHANSWKKFQGQEMAWRSVVEQRVGGNDALVGLMLESHLFEGNQKFGGDPRPCSSTGSPSPTSAFPGKRPSKAGAVGGGEDRRGA